MTLQNMRYIAEIARQNSVSKAAAALYMTQSALSTAVKDTEEELGIQIFVRTNRGVTLTPDGQDCLQYCLEILEQADRLSARYKNRDTAHVYFSVSSQHLPFAVRAFRELITSQAPERYNAAIYELSTSQIIQDVSSNKSEFGIIVTSDRQLRLLNKHFFTADLFFTQLAEMKTYVFLRKEHPLAKKDSISIEMLRSFPFVTYDRSSDPIYYTEETALYEPLDQCIHVSDRATKMALIRSSNAFSIGVDLPNFNADIFFKDASTELVAVPFANQPEPLLAGYLEKGGHVKTEIGKEYIELLNKHISRLSLPGTD